MMAQLKTACPQGRSQRNLKARWNLIIPITTLGQKEIHLVYNDKIEQESGLIKILVPKEKDFLVVQKLESTCQCKWTSCFWKIPDAVGQLGN